MSFLSDTAARRYAAFLLCACVLLPAVFSMHAWCAARDAGGQVLDMQRHMVSSLLMQGIDEDVVVAAVCAGESSPQGERLLAQIGRAERGHMMYLVPMREFAGRHALHAALLGMLASGALLFGALCYLRGQEMRFARAADGVQAYLDGDFSAVLPSEQPGALGTLMTLVEKLSFAVQTRSESEHAQKEFLKDTISDISHQFKTPLSALDLYMQILLSEPDNVQAVSRFAGQAQHSIARLERLVGLLLKVMRFDAGSVAFDMRHVRVCELAQQAVQELSQRAAKEGKTLTLEGDASLTLRCDLGWTVEALSNLVKNALDHTQTGGHVRVFWMRTPMMLRIGVEDDGEGIAPEDVMHVFKRFYTGRCGNDKQGVGLGLPLARAIAQGQGGTISVQSRPGAGSTFVLSFLTNP